MHRRREMAHTVPTKAFVKLSLDVAMLFAPFRYTYPSPSPTLIAHAEPISQGHCWK